MSVTVPPPVAELLDGRVRRLDRRARTKWVIQRASPGVVLGVVAIIIVAANADSGLVLFWLVVVGIITGSACGSAVLSYRFWSWSAHDDALELARGVIYRRTSVVPYHRIQQIDIERDPIERMLGISTLVLRSAAATTDAKVPGIALEHSDALRHALLDRAGAGDAV